LFDLNHANLVGAALGFKNNFFVGQASTSGRLDCTVVSHPGSCVCMSAFRRSFTGSNYPQNEWFTV